MEYNFFEIFDEIYNQNIKSLEEPMQVYMEHRKNEKKLTVKKVLIFILVIITLPLFPFCLIWDILLFKHVHELEVKQYKSDDGNYISLLNEKIITPLLKRIFGDASSDVTNGIENSDYNIVSDNEEYDWDKYSSHGLTEIPINPEGYKLKLANVFTYHEVSYYDHNDHLETRTEQLFGGLVGVINLPFNTNARINITGNEVKSNKIELDMREFEEIFNVSATNEIIARQILTADKMEKLLEMKNKIYNIGFDIAINNDKLYIRFHQKTIFNFDMGKAIDKKQYEDTINTLTFVKRMAEDIVANIVIDSNIG